MSRRVVVTGIGAVTPVGHGRAGFWAGVRRGRTAVGPLKRFDATPFRSRYSAEIRDFVPSPSRDPRRARRLDRFSQFAIAAARYALLDAGLSLDASRTEPIGCYLGSALGGIAFGEEQHVRYLREGFDAVDPALALVVFGGAGAANVAIEFGLRGPAVGNANSCASGAIAIGEAFRLIRAGGIDVLLAGGAEAPLAPLTFGAFARIRAMSAGSGEPECAMRPFDRERDGFVMGEGGALLVLEEIEHARARGARPLAELLGYGTTNDAHHMLAPLASGAEAARAMTLALQDARLDPGAIDYLNAHATSTPRGDAAEALAIRTAFGPAAERLPVSSTKGLYGHPLGASGAIEAALAALVLKHGWLPPTTGLRQPDPDCDLRFVPPGGQFADLSFVMTNSFGFGGINVSLVLGRAPRHA